MEEDVVVLEDADTLADEAAERFAALAERAVGERGRFGVALAGGSTPRRLHARLAAEPLRARVDWSRVHVFFGDERFVPADSEDSNYRTALDTLLAEVGVPEENVTPFATEGLDPEEAASLYERELLRFGGGSPPRLDLVLLGLGEDGHTASLFPGQPEVVDPSERLVAAVRDAPKPPPDRLTLTYRAINAARAVLILASGEVKADAVALALRGEGARDALPVRGVRPTDGALVWLLDRAAASGLG